MGRMYHDIQKAQDTFMTSPLVMEQILFSNGLRSMARTSGPLRQSAIGGLRKIGGVKTADNRTAVDVVQRYYNERYATQRARG